MVYQAIKNIKSSVVRKELKKGNKVFGFYMKPNPKLSLNERLIVYTKCGIHFYNPKDFKISKNQKITNIKMGIN